MPKPTPAQTAARKAAIAEAEALLERAREKLRKAWGVEANRRALADVAAAAAAVDAARAMEG